MSLDSWMIYNGFISYVLMGILMLVEYLVRLKVKKQQLVMSAGISKTVESATSDE